MLVKNIGNALLGALLSLIAAYLLIVSSVLKNELDSSGGSSIRLMDLFIGAPAYVLANTYWILIPIGLLSGLLIPFLVSKKTRREALLYGILTGVILGLVFACFVAYDFAVGSVSPADAHDGVKWWGRFWGQFASSVPITIVYCSIWTCVYALIRSGGASVKQEVFVRSKA